MTIPKRGFLFLLTGLFLFACNGDERENFAPVADAGFDQIVTMNESLVTLDGSGSNDAEGASISYQWDLVSRPSGSKAYLENALTVTPSLAADMEGTYQISLVVNDGERDGMADFVVVDVVDRAVNVILFIGDGMGFEQVKAAGMYANGTAGSLLFEHFPFKGSVTTLNAKGAVTDSAASATAMATGFKVHNGVISVTSPGDESPLETILEIFKVQNLNTGLVTTTTITHATPAAFGAHELSRKNRTAILLDYLNDSQPNVLLGGARFINSGTAEEVGYVVVEDRYSMLTLDTEIQDMVWGQFGESNMPYELDGLGVLPHLSETTETALAVLDNNPEGFFLMVEGGRIDHAGHSNDIQRNVFETIEFSNAVKAAKTWAAGRTDTIIIVTADHETGDLKVTANNGKGNYPEVTWGTTGHTASNVPVFAWGVNAHLVAGEIDNTDIFHVIRVTAF